MNPFTRIASKHASKMDCSSHFPLTVLSEDGWITISDTTQPAIAPREKKLLDEKVEHENRQEAIIAQEPYPSLKTSWNMEVSIKQHWKHWDMAFAEKKVDRVHQV